MDPQVRTLIQNVLDAYIPPRTHTGDPQFNPQDSGRYAGQDAPDTLAQFRVRLEDAVKSFEPNGWSLDKIEKAETIADGMTIYTAYYGGWATLPLDGDAPQAVKDWQAKARKEGI